MHDKRRCERPRMLEDKVDPVKRSINTNPSEYICTVHSFGNSES